PSAGQSQYLRPASPRTCRRQRMDRPVTLDSERLSANVSATLFTDTDVTLSGDYYVYQQNPAQVGFFTLVAPGRGAGVPIAPLRYEVGRRWSTASAISRRASGSRPENMCREPGRAP